MSKINGLMGTVSQKGILALVVAPDGTGKTKFLESLENYFKDYDSSVRCIREDLRQVDDPITFFSRLNKILRTEMHATRQKILDKIRKNKPAIELAAKVATNIPGVPSVIESAVQPLFTSDVLTAQSEIESKFIDTITDFTKKYREHILTVLTDNIDTNPQKTAFIHMLNDIKERIPTNVMLVLTSRDELIKSDHIISLQTFDDDEVREFLVENFPTIEEEEISQLINKSNGYPASLGWLWENRHTNIRALIRQLPQRGMVEQLKKNFLDNFLKNLSDKEKEAFELCAVSVAISKFMLSALTDIDTITAENIIKSFKEAGVLVLASFGLTSDNQPLEVYTMSALYKSAARSTIKIPSELHSKVMNHLAKVLIINSFTSTADIGLMLQQYSNIDPTINPERFFNLLRFDSKDKLKVCFLVTYYYYPSGQQNKTKQFAEMIPKLSKDIEDLDVQKVWNNISEFFLLELKEDRHGNKVSRALQIINEIIPLVDSKFDPTIGSRIKGYFQGIKYVINRKSYDKDAASFLDNFDFRQALTSIIPQTFLSQHKHIFDNEKVMKIIGLAVGGINAYGANVFDAAIYALSKTIASIDDLRQEDKEIVEEVLTNIGMQKSVDEYKTELEIILGFSHLKKLANTDESEEIDDNAVYEELKKSSKYLEPLEADESLASEVYLKVKRFIKEYQEEG